MPPAAQVLLGALVYSAADVPPNAMVCKFNVPVPVLVMVTVCATEVVATVCAHDSALGDT